MEKSSLTLKLLIDTKAKRVLFAEADKGCVDFLFHLLSLPLATVISLLKKQGMMGSLGNLYESIKNMNESYIQPNKSKDALLKPVLARAQCSSIPLPLLGDAPSQKKKLYRCGNCCYGLTVSDDPASVCPSCSQKMTTTVTYVAPPTVTQDEGGFVKGLVTYMVMDDLVVKPMSTISSITLLNKFNVRELASLEEKVVDLGMNEALSLLKASLQSEKVLTDVFLKSKMAAAN